MSNKVENNVWKSGVQIWLRLAFAAILCFIVWVSIDAMGLSFFGQTTGYKIYQYDENGENPQIVVSHVFTEGEDREAEIAVEDNQVITYSRSLPPTPKAVFAVLSAIFTWLIYALFPYNRLWNMGNRDENYVQLGHIKKDEYFGLKVGCVASIPSAVLYILLVLGKFGLFSPVILRWHRLINTPFITYIDAVSVGAKSATDLSFGSLLALGAILLFIPFVSWLGYYLGYRHISIREHLIYKKNTKK